MVSGVITLCQLLLSALFLSASFVCMLMDMNQVCPGFPYRTRFRFTNFDTSHLYIPYSGPSSPAGLEPIAGLQVSLYCVAHTEALVVGAYDWGTWRTQTGTGGKEALLFLQPPPPPPKRSMEETTETILRRWDPSAQPFQDPFIAALSFR